MGFVLSDRIIEKSSVKDKQQMDSAAVRDGRQTPGDFSSLYSKGESSGCPDSMLCVLLLIVWTGGFCHCWAATKHDNVWCVTGM